MQNLGEIITITQTHFHPSCSSPRTNDVFCSVRSGTALPAELELYCKCALPFSPVFFIFFYFINLLDTRLRFALTAYSSLKHSLKSVSLSHTHRYTRYTPLPKKNTLLQLHRWGEHSYRMRFVSKRAPMAVWGVWFEKYEWRFGFVGNSSSFFLHFFFVHLLNPALGKLTKIWITHFVYSYSWRPFRLSRAGNSQHRRCEYCTAENSLLAF